MFLTDANDVIVIAKDPNLVMRAMPKGRIQAIPGAERQSVYGRRDFESVTMSPARFDGMADLVHWQDSRDPSVFIRHGGPDDLLAVNVVSPLVGTDVIKADRVLLAFLLTVIGLLVVVSATGAAAFLRARIRHNRDLQELNRALTVQARTDPLTGCVNRRYFLELLEAERQRASRYAKPFSLLALDLDHFKEVNDRFGHPAGDDALCHFTNVVSSMLRASDTLGRMGGEEFAILLPETSLNEAVAMAERIRHAFAESPHPLEAITMTVSVGVAELHMAGIDTVETLLARADGALYDAKNAGRNLVRTQSHAEYVQPQLDGLEMVSE
jgi:diguanylate cyclase (GGDEF)-like protein